MVSVMTPDGEAQVSIPAGTAPGRSLRLKGKGWPSKTGRGDLLLTLTLAMPPSWSEEERRLLEQLRAKRTDHPRQESGFVRRPSDRVTLTITPCVWV